MESPPVVHLFVPIVATALALHEQLIQGWARAHID